MKPKKTHTELDIPIAKLARNSGNELHVRLCEYNHHQFLDLRNFMLEYPGGGGFYTKKGTSVPVTLMGPLRTAIDQAIKAYDKFQRENGDDEDDE